MKFLFRPKFRVKNKLWSNKFIKEFTNRNWFLSSVNKLLTMSDQTDSDTVDRKPSSGKKCRTRIAQNIDSVEELVLSQESAPRALTKQFVSLPKILEFPKRQCIY